ncbi:c-type cytochrome [Psychroflexus tropicus]|uniref:c-type cytochrome n=1 Tax=Psychroflexus tropicus TaxID=197345 RepID=UPI0003609AD0|nr:cytochrome c [Psychroflexus tropicus]
MKFLVFPIAILLNLLIWNSDSDDETSQYVIISQEKSLEKSIEDGKAVYSGFCMRCHLGEGEGVEGIYPPLANSNWLSEKRKESIKSVKYGLKGEIVVNDKTYNNNMAAMGLSDREVADVMNYIMNDFGNQSRDLPKVTLKEVSELTED